MEKLIYLIILALLCESIWETLKMTWQEGKLKVDRVGALAIGLILALTTNTDILHILGIPVKYSVGVICTGILISRGANFTHDLLVKLSTLKVDK